VCEGAGGGGERDGGADRKREGDARCMMMAWLIDLLWYYSHVSQEAIIRSVQFPSPSLVFFQQTSSSSASFFCTLLRRGFGESSVLVRNNPFSFQLGSTYLCKSMSCYALICYFYMHVPVQSSIFYIRFVQTRFVYYID